MMTPPPYIAQTLYRDGQLAIIAELIVIVGIFILFLGGGRDLMSGTDFETIMRTARQLGQDRPLIYFLSFSCTALLPWYYCWKREITEDCRMAKIG